MRELPTNLKLHQEGQQRLRRWLALRVVLVVELIIVITVALYFLQPQWLPLVYRALDVTEPPSRAEALLVLGGGYGERARTAGKIFSRVDPMIVTIDGAISTENVDDKILRDAGIPASMIYRFTNVNSTFEEAEEILRFLHTRGITSAIIITDAFHSHRARATYICLNNWNHYGISFHVVAADDGLTPDNWWFIKYNRDYVWTEWFKNAFYVVRYGVTCF